MADNLKKLGEKQISTVGVTTLYTCPSGKSAKGKFLFRGISGAASVFILYRNGMEICRKVGAVGDILFSSTGQMVNLIVAATGAAGLTGASNTTHVGNGPTEFILAAGDTVSYEIQVAAFSAMYASFDGIELDAV
jgi:hypothetical protein